MPATGRPTPRQGNRGNPVGGGRQAPAHVAPEDYSSVDPAIIYEDRWLVKGFRSGFGGTVNLAEVEFFDAGEGVDLFEGLVGADAEDAGEAEGEA